MFTNSMKGRLAQAAGASAETLVRGRLTWLGVPFVQRIHTGWKIIRRNGVVIDARPVERVAGDWWGILPDGRCLLVEVKDREAEKLSLSDLEPHQRRALDAVQMAGGVSVVAWVTPRGDCWFLDWPIRELTKGHPLAEDRATILDTHSVLRSIGRLRVARPDPFRQPSSEGADLVGGSGQME